MTMSKWTLPLFLIFSLVFIGFTADINASGGSAEICNVSGCQIKVVVETNFGNLDSAKIANGDCHKFNFSALTECAAVITVNTVDVNQPQSAICESVFTGAICPQRLCVTGTNTWEVQ